jgi:hypothetical protein
MDEMHEGKQPNSHKTFPLKVILKSSEEVASKAIQLLKEILTNLGPRLQE